MVLPTTSARDADAPAANLPDRAAAPHRCLNILLVEDHQDTAQALSESLMTRGHRVRVVRGVQAALREAAADPCEVLISDIGLPDGNGCDLMRRFQECGGNLGIAITGFGKLSMAVKREREVITSRCIVAVRPANSAMSAPAMNALSPAPVMTTTPTDSSSRSSSNN
jgi:CheY-like chemotaxis protein